MSLLLNIDTALETASVCISKNGKSIDLLINNDPKDHAAWLHSSIDSLLKKNQIDIGQLDAIAVSNGPGSYTGLRVGLAAAKGFCFALQIPLLTVNTLQLMAFAVADEADELICPVIDARRMEVYTAVYNKKNEEKIPPHAVVVTEDSFADLLTNKIVFCGNAVTKIRHLLSNENASFSQTHANASHLAILATSLFTNNEFADLAYVEPFYLKEFYTVRKS